MFKLGLTVPLLLLCLPTLAHDYVAVVQASKPAVVTLEVSNKFRWGRTKQQKQAEKMLEKHSDLFEQKDNKRTAKSYGSGFLISADGQILTAAHVVNDPASIIVNLANGQKAKASVLKIDKRRDVALLQIDDSKKLTDLKTLVLSDSSPQEGQNVLVMGGAFGLPVSASSGIISAVDVSLAKRDKHTFVLTDAATNPGSSGGPLLNENGLVIGIISKIFSKTGTFSGTAVALPTAELKIFLAEK